MLIGTVTGVRTWTIVLQVARNGFIDKNDLLDPNAADNDEFSRLGQFECTPYMRSRMYVLTAHGSTGDGRNKGMNRQHDP